MAGRVAQQAFFICTPVPLIWSRRWLAVNGSVEQPRDGSALASWSIMDTGTNELTFRRVGYDSATTAGKLRFGEPETLKGVRQRL